jgi:hypothetical protein
LYWTDVLQARDYSRFVWWHLSVALVASCLKEIENRLAKHPTSQEVHRLFGRNDGAALRALLRRINGVTGNLHHRKSHTPYLQAKQGKRPIDDEKASVLNFLLTEQVEKFIHTNLGQTQIPEWAQPYFVLQAAMDGKFEILPAVMRRRFIDYLRAEYATKRGGKVKVFEPVTFDGESESDREPDADENQGVARKKALSQIGQHLQEVWNRTTFDLQRRDLAKMLVPGSGGNRRSRRADIFEKFLQFHLEHPDEGLTDRVLAHRLGVDERSIRNYRARCVRLFLSPQT